MLLSNVEKSLRKKDKERSWEWLANTGPKVHYFKIKNVENSREYFDPLPNKPGFYMSALKSSLYKKTAGKGEIALNEQFLLFPQCFLPFWRTFHYFHEIQNCRLQGLWVLRRLKFVVWERIKEKQVSTIIQMSSLILSRSEIPIMSINKCKAECFHI